MSLVDERLKEYGTPRQAEVIEALNRAGGYRAAARALGIDRQVIRKAVKACERKAGLAGYAPGKGVNRPLPEHLKLNGTSALVDERTGETRVQGTGLGKGPPPPWSCDGKIVVVTATG